MDIKDELILDLLTDFTCAREKLVQALKKLGFSDKQTHLMIMQHQEETQRLYIEFNQTLQRKLKKL